MLIDQKTDLSCNHQRLQQSIVRFDVDSGYQWLPALPGSPMRAKMTEITSISPRIVKSVRVDLSKMYLSFRVEYWPIFRRVTV